MEYISLHSVYPVNACKTHFKPSSVSYPALIFGFCCFGTLNCSFCEVAVYMLSFLPLSLIPKGYQTK